MKKQALFLLLFCVSFSVLTQAQIIYSDDFSSATPGARLSSGTGSGNGYDGWNSNSSFCAQGGFCSSICNWYTVVGTQLTSPVVSYMNSVNSVLLTSNTEGPGRCFATSFTPNLTTGDAIYMGVLVKFTSCPDNNGSSKGDFIRLLSGPFAIFARIGANGNGGSLKFRVGADSNIGPAETPAGSPYNFNQTYFLVLKYQFIPGASDQVRLYVNPPSSGEPASAEAVVNSSGINADPTAFKGFQFNGLNAVTTSGIPSGNVGGIRVARTWADLFSVIPVELQSFEATTKGATNLLSWKTATELNVAQFDVEKSADGKTNWSRMGSVKAAGNSSVARTYNFIDEAPLSISYYRLRTIDNDGKEEMSKVVSVNRTSNALKINKLSPMPATLENLTVDMQSGGGVVTMTLTDIFGKAIQTEKKTVTEGFNTLNIPLSKIANGVYFLTVSDGRTQITEKVVKQ